MNPMRIGVAIEYFDPRLGGAERSTDQIVRELARRGHSVVVLAGAAPRNLDGICGTGGVKEGIEIIRWRKQRKPHTGLDAIRFSRWASRRLFSSEFDSSLSVTSSVPARLVQPRSGIMRESMRRAIVAAGSPFRGASRRVGQILSPRKWGLLFLESRTFADPRVARFVAISEYMKRQMQSHYAIKAPRIVVVANAVEIDSFAGAERRTIRRRLRAGRGWSDNQPVVFFPALDARRKGMVPLLRAMAKVGLRLPNVRIAVAGHCPAWAHRIAVELGVDERVDDLGVVPAMNEMYCAVDLTVMPSYYDPASKVVIESMVLGTPVVTSQYNGSSDWIHRCDNPSMGRVVNEPDDIDGLAETIIELLSSIE